ncbi:hypothetical protein BH09PSE3_BH09PSE3_01090 [soil metagenome]
MRLFRPLLAGSNLRDRLIACFGALIGIGFTGFVSMQIAPDSFPWLIAPIGGSAVLMFALPSSPLSQPWSIIGGNTIAAFTGIAVNGVIGEPVIAAAVSVSVAVLMMSLFRCLHATGGAVALSAVLGHHIFAGHFELLVLPVVLNSILLVFIGWVFHRYSGQSYPHRPTSRAGTDTPPPSYTIVIEDIDSALADLGETFDVSKEDLVLLFAQAEAHADARIKRLYATETTGP